MEMILLILLSFVVAAEITFAIDHIIINIMVSVLIIIPIPILFHFIYVFYQDQEIDDKPRLKLQDVATASIDQKDEESLYQTENSHNKVEKEVVTYQHDLMGTIAMDPEDSMTSGNKSGDSSDDGSIPKEKEELKQLPNNNIKNKPPILDVDDNADDNDNECVRNVNIELQNIEETQSFQL